MPRPLLIRLSYPFKKVAPLFFKGNNVECNVCGKSFRKFLGYGGHGALRQNVLCPYDLTLERHRLMWLYLKEHSNFFQDQLKVLHVAPEQCFHQTFKAQENLDYTTADLVSPIADIHFDLHDIPLEDNQYDVIFCNHVMEHVDDPIRCMSELHRVMKPGGWAIMQVPQDFDRNETLEDPEINTPELRQKHYWQKDHVRLFGMDYPQWLEKAGFTVDTFDPTEHLSKEQLERYRFMPREVLYIARKN